MYRLMKYTMRCRAFDGETITVERAGYFTDAEVLRARIRAWNGAFCPNGGVYEYFETPEQAIRNNAAPILPKQHPYPSFTCLWHGNENHNYHFVK